MLDATTTAALHPDQQDAAAAHDRCQVPSGSRPVWCVAATLPKAERTAHAELHRRGFQAYLPLITTRWRDRTWHTGPLFPGYLFVRLRLDQPWNPVRYAPGVFSLLSVDGIPSICPDDHVEAVRSALRAVEHARRLGVAEKTKMPPGTPVAVANGVLQNCHGVVVASHTDRDMATVAIMMAGHLCRLLVHTDHLVPAGETAQ